LARANAVHPFDNQSSVASLPVVDLERKTVGSTNIAGTILGRQNDLNIGGGAAWQSNPSGDGE